MSLPDHLLPQLQQLVTGGPATCSQAQELCQSLGVPLPLNRMDLTDKRLDHRNLRGADLSGIQHKLSLVASDLSGASLRSVDAPMSRVTRARFVGADLTGASLPSLSANNANFQGALLHHTNLSRSSLIVADFEGADLSEARLNAAIASHADFTGAQLAGVTFRGADLGGATLPTPVARFLADHIEHFPPTLVLTDEPTVTFPITARCVSPTAPPVPEDL